MSKAIPGKEAVEKRGPAGAFLFCAAVCLFLLSASVFAAGSGPDAGTQPGGNAPPPAASADDPFLVMDLYDALRLNVEARRPDVEPAKLETLFFSLWQHSLLQDAKQKFRTRPPDASELATAADQGPKPRGHREISLGGIVYVNAEEWTVWLNNERITPKALPKEVLDIKVHRHYIELKWIDSYNNLIYPVRIRPHQRFNLDSRIFLPGAGVENF